MSDRLNRYSRLSEAVKRSRAPLTSEVLAFALQDRIHSSSGRLLAAVPLVRLARSIQQTLAAEGVEVAFEEILTRIEDEDGG